jgi:hypothetical protein
MTPCFGQKQKRRLRGGKFLGLSGREREKQKRKADRCPRLVCLTLSIAGKFKLFPKRPQSLTGAPFPGTGRSLAEKGRERQIKNEKRSKEIVNHKAGSRTEMSFSGFAEGEVQYSKDRFAKPTSPSHVSFPP